MKYMTYGFLLSLVLMTSIEARAGNPIKNTEKGVTVKSWFNNAKCDQLVVTRFKTNSGKTPTHVLQISDAKAVGRLQKRIEAVSADGDKMVSFITDEELQLSFNCGTIKIGIEIYNGNFKTPSTGFNSSEKDLALEEQIYTDLKSLIEPQVGRRILAVENLAVAFPDFTFTFQGVNVRKQQPGEPTIGSISTSRFIVKAGNDPAQNLSVVSGQKAPQPLPFEIGGKSYILRTFTDEAGVRLDPDYFLIQSSTK